MCDDNRARHGHTRRTEGSGERYENQSAGLGAGSVAGGTSYAEGWVRSRPALARRLDLTDEETENVARPLVELIERVGKLTTLDY